MIVLAQAVNEEKYVNRVLDHIINEPFCERFILIDGGSTDYTREAVLEYEKTEVYVHPWLDWYHDQNIIQRNIGFSYIPHGETAVFIDFDECFSHELITWLNNYHAGKYSKITDTVSFSRRTFNLLRHEDSTFAVIEDGWPVPLEQIGQYPDYQLRMIVKKPGMHFINSPHHVLFGVNEGLFTNSCVDCDILHYDGKDDSRDRANIEKKWARAQARRKELGLLPDVFECQLKPEFKKYGSIGAWRTNPNGR